MVVPLKEKLGFSDYFLISLLKRTTVPLLYIIVNKSKICLVLLFCIKYSIINQFNISIYHNILLYQNGKTATYEALKIARDIIFTPGGGDRAGIQDIIILVTDGQPNPLPPDFMELVDDIKRRGVEIIGLGVAEADDELMWEVRMYTSKEWHRMKHRNTCMGHFVIHTPLFVNVPMQGKE